MNYIGSFYEDGWVVERDLDAAEEQYRMAAEGGDFRGQFNYARLRAEKGDVETALAWLARVRETGTPAFMDKAEHWLRGSPIKALRDRGIRSEEHTSELQSLMRISYAVFCLKKKKNKDKQREQ